MLKSQKVEWFTNSVELFPKVTLHLQIFANAMLLWVYFKLLEEKQEAMSSAGFFFVVYLFVFAVRK